MKRHIAHWLMDQMWLCSARWHGRIPFAPFCLVEWAYGECVANHSAEWKEVEAVRSDPLIVTRSAHVRELNIHIAGSISTSSSGATTRILKATVRGPMV